MPLYTVLVTVKVSAESKHEAYGFIRHALDHAKKAEILHIDSEVIETAPDEEWDDIPVVKPIRTRQERLQAMADRGCDTWEEYRGER
jgi:hypothetical protein